MKIIFALLLLFSFSAGNTQVLKKIGDKVKNKTEQRADQKVDQAIDKGLDKTEETGKKKDDNSSNSDKSPGSVRDTSAAPVQQASLKVYSNYDFVPGDKILFEDHFTDDQDGEFATHWELKGGQAILNKNNGELAMHLTDGNYAVVLPRMKTEKYLSDPFTLEFDWYHVPGAYGIIIQMGIYDKQNGFDTRSEISI